MSRHISMQGQWSSRLIFILAATGSTIGLGNIWRFPYLAGENGGGAFILAYLACIALIGIPLMMAEVLIGRRGRQNPVFSLQTLAHEANGSRAWKLAGAIGMLTGLLILSYYSVIAGWALAYLVRMASGSLIRVTAEGAGSIFAQLVTDPERLLAWHTIFMVLTVKVVAGGVARGLERAVRILMPLLFLFVIILVVYAWRTGDFAQAYTFMFSSDFSKLSPGAWLTAMGHAFFTLSLGFGALLVYGAYLPAGTSIARTSTLVVLLDTVVALLAGLAIFPLVFANGLSVGEGPGLIFQTLPVAFGQLPGGALFGALFFLLLVLAAWSSAIALLEPMVSWLIESRQMSRIQASIRTGIFVWLLGIVTIFSFSRWSFSFDFAGIHRRHGLFDVLDILTSGIMLPLGGLSLVLFVGWVMARESVSDELGGQAGFRFRIWYFVIRFITPAAIMLIFLRAIGVV